MANLELTYPPLFQRSFGEGNKFSDRFLLALIKSLKGLRGQKIVTVYGTNSAKIKVAGVWKQHVLHEPFIVLGGCQCAAWCSNGTPHPDKVNDWVTHQSQEIRTKVSREGTPVSNYWQTQWVMIGCLLCRKKTLFWLP